MADDQAENMPGLERESMFRRSKRKATLNLH